jgi:ABC-type transporter Mla MlaB component
MWRITIAETATEQRWILEGSLAGPWVDELSTKWKMGQRTQNGQPCTIDLSEVSFVDKDGERLLQTMSKEGAQLVAPGIYIKYLLQQRFAR